MFGGSLKDFSNGTDYRVGSVPNFKVTAVPPPTPPQIHHILLPNVRLIPYKLLCTTPNVQQTNFRYTISHPVPPPNQQ
jgi:hypothetical protein